MKLSKHKISKLLKHKHKGQTRKLNKNIKHKTSYKSHTFRNKKKYVNLRTKTLKKYMEGGRFTDKGSAIAWYKNYQENFMNRFMNFEEKNKTDTKYTVLFNNFEEFKKKDLIKQSLNFEGSREIINRNPPNLINSIQSAVKIFIEDNYEQLSSLRDQQLLNLPLIPQAEDDLKKRIAKKKIKAQAAFELEESPLPEPNAPEPNAPEPNAPEPNPPEPNPPEPNASETAELPPAPTELPPAPAELPPAPPAAPEEIKNNQCNSTVTDWFSKSSEETDLSIELTNLKRALIEKNIPLPDAQSLKKCINNTDIDPEIARKISLAIDEVWNSKESPLLPPVDVNTPLPLPPAPAPAPEQKPTTEVVNDVNDENENENMIVGMCKNIDSWLQNSGIDKNAILTPEQFTQLKTENPIVNEGTLKTCLTRQGIKINDISEASPEAPPEAPPPAPAPSIEFTENQDEEASAQLLLAQQEIANLKLNLEQVKAQLVDAEQAKATSSEAMREAQENATKTLTQAEREIVLAREQQEKLNNELADARISIENKTIQGQAAADLVGELTGKLGVANEQLLSAEQAARQAKATLIAAQAEAAREKARAEAEQVARLQATPGTDKGKDEGTDKGKDEGTDEETDKGTDEETDKETDEEIGKGKDEDKGKGKDTAPKVSVQNDDNNKITIRIEVPKNYTHDIVDGGGNEYNSTISVLPKGLKLATTGGGSRRRKNRKLKNRKTRRHH